MQNFFIYLGGIFVLIAISAKGIVETFIVSRIFSKEENEKNEKHKKIMFRVRVIQAVAAIVGAIILFTVMIIVN